MREMQITVLLPCFNLLTKKLVKQMSAQLSRVWHGAESQRGNYYFGILKKDF